MVMNPASIEGEERRAIEAYCAEHKVEDLVQDLVEGLLRDRPETGTAKEHFAHMLRLQVMKEQEQPEVMEEAAEEAVRTAEVPGALLKNLFEATKKITGEIVPRETIMTIIQETRSLLNCDRVSLFIYDRRIDMLVLNASNLEQPIRVKPGQGIAGHVFTTQNIVNIPNCYEDARFDQTFDKVSGYKTSNLLTMPIVDFEGECMGVLQAINKLEIQSPGFTAVDEVLMENLTQHVSIALRNAEVYRAAIVTSERASALLQMIQSLSEDLGVQSMILNVATHANQLVQADRCSVFLVDDARDQLWSVATDSGKEIRIPKNAGIAGECATECKLIVIDDAYQDSRFNQEVDQKTGYCTKSIIAVPVKRPPMHDAACAIIQMINKTEFDGAVGRFDDEDIQVLETFATFVAGKLAKSLLLTSRKHPESEAALMSGSSGSLGDSPAKRRSFKAAQEFNSFAEEDEENCEDS
eukprot:TRINITY_DN11378_c2_g2_i1.p1 TRINITY_DN11378_c2_g2~~TRINITY_DN11378_c2_g2_i1.p1  ORF type:complete len:467 (+),score=109.81 TRINITY_DN11378_c2_g2_i1:190-1590(+)